MSAGLRARRTSVVSRAARGCPLRTTSSKPFEKPWNRRDKSSASVAAARAYTSRASSSARSSSCAVLLSAESGDDEVAQVPQDVLGDVGQVEALLGQLVDDRHAARRVASDEGRG